MLTITVILKELMPNVKGQQDNEIDEDCIAI